ncbi:MAG: hypothetical protein RH949_30835 [Coleofasciculus sp. A1-SPW-01]|uniref:hypothetical protein n=1 Tax=Coleofasciculus sp. A1-SPW-01 TaxID=3070819 RepID=UPI0032F1B864
MQQVDGLKSRYSKGFSFENCHNQFRIAIEKRGSLENVIDLWKESAKASLNAKNKYGDKIIIVLFEDIVQKTELVMNFISEIVGIKFNEILTSPTFNSIPIASNSEYNSSNVVDEEVVSRYKKILDNNTIDEIISMTHSVYNECLEFEIK